MVEISKMEAYKRTIQSIIDKYLPESERFSVEDFDEEQLGYICKLLIEKDNHKRKLLWKEVWNKSNQAKYEYENKYNEILKNKELFETHIKTFNDIDNLSNNIDTQKEQI